MATILSQEQIPQQMRERILRLARQGYSRWMIKSHLGLYGNQYWMIKVVCDNNGTEKLGD